MNLYQKVKSKKPLVYSITNYVTVNDVANAILSVGAAPLMADDKAEVAHIASFSSSLVINIGTLNKRVVKSSIIAGKKANEVNIPVVLDPVGVGASSLRNEAVKKLLKKVKFAVIKGNLTEIKALYLQKQTTSGVDVSSDDKLTTDNLEETVSLLKKISIELNTIIAATGEIDIITDGVKTNLCYNGNEKMSLITGTGCMSAGIIASFCSVDKNYLDATTKAISLMGQAGDIALERYRGLGSFRVDIIDALSNITNEEIKDNANIKTL